MCTGKILLKREGADFSAGFCLINKELPELIKDLSMLHPEEINYYETLKFDKRKTSYLLGRMAAKQAVLELLSTDNPSDSFAIQFGVFQFPVVKYIRDQNIQVCISHCDSLGIALAYSEEHPMAIDLEKIALDNTDTMLSVMAHQEYDLISLCSLDKSMGSTLIWTVKEALSKVLRTGLTLDFKILEISSLQKIGSSYLSRFKNFPQYQAISHKVGDYMCSIVLPKNSSCDFSFFWNALIKSNLIDP